MRSSFAIPYVSIYSIRELAKLSGIKAHTIRIWEQRYSLLSPRRTDTNIRFYIESDLQLLLNVALLNRNGFKISKIAKLSSEEIVEKAASLTNNVSEHISQVDGLTMAMIEMDEYKFDRIITANINHIGFERTVIDIIHPFLDKLSVLWLTGSINPCQENFITCLIRQKLVAAIDSEPVALGESVKKIVLFLPDDINQELSLLLMQYLIKSRKHRAIYLGKNVFPDDIQKVFEIIKPDYFFTIVSEFQNDQDIHKYLAEIQLKSGEAEVLVTGIQSHQNGIPPISGVHIFQSLDDTISFLDNM